MKHDLVFGFLGPSCTGEARKVWNAEFQKRELDAFFDFYRTKTFSDLELRLSEMFLHDRRGYIVHPTFQEVVVPLLDSVDDSVQSSAVDIIVNRGGILIGGYNGSILSIEASLSFWGFTT